MLANLPFVFAPKAVSARFRDFGKGFFRKKPIKKRQEKNASLSRSYYKLVNFIVTCDYG